MDDENKFTNLRHHPRISWHFVVKFRLKDGQEKNWQVSTVKDISEGGCFFYSNVAYQIGQVLEIRVQFPSIEVPMFFTGEVRRCELENVGQLSLYGVGVCFLGMDEEKRKYFIETITYFLKKQKQ
jgi:hypothetical protein